MGTINVEREDHKLVKDENNMILGSIATYVITDPWGKTFTFEDVFIGSDDTEAFLVCPSTNEEVEIYRLSKPRMIKSAYN